jgi:hypothetical protein
MGTLLSRPSRQMHERQEPGLTGAEPPKTSPALSGSAVDADLRAVDEVLGKILDRLGPARIEQATVAPTCLVLHPCHLDQGEQIASDLGLTSALDHHRSVPGYTIWSGKYLGVEVQLRASLRRGIGSDL